MSGSELANVTFKSPPRQVRTMKLLEYKGKELLAKFGIKIPPSILVNNKNYVNLSYHKEKYREFFLEHKQVMIKGQVIGTNRKEKGLISEANDFEKSLVIIDQMYKQVFNNVPVSSLLIEKKLEVAEEYFLAIRYDAATNGPVILLSKTGGSGIEMKSKNLPPATQAVSITTGLASFLARELVKRAGFSRAELAQVSAFVRSAYNCFIESDCRTLEINPIIKTTAGQLVAGDAKIEIDNNAIARQEFLGDATENEEISFLNEREIEARRIDQSDYRGVAGKTFVDLDGDIAVLASGGGASLVCMDALLEAGGTPANYTEYSGNPSREKVAKLTKLTLSKPNLHGCLVIGGTANFTDIYETLCGFIEGVKSLAVLPKYPIVVRRAGPRDVEAFDMLLSVAKETGLNLALYDETTPMTTAVQQIVQKAAKFRSAA